MSLDQRFHLEGHCIVNILPPCGGNERFKYTLSCDLCDADDGHDVCEGSGPPELSALLRDQLGPGGHEGSGEPHERCQELEDGRRPHLTRRHVSRETSHGVCSITIQLLPNLYHLRSGVSRGACVGAIQDKLESMAGEVAQVMDEQLQVGLTEGLSGVEYKT